MIGYFFMSGLALRAISPPFGKCMGTLSALWRSRVCCMQTRRLTFLDIAIDTAQEQKLEGDFRFTHVRE